MTAQTGPGAELDTTYKRFRADGWPYCPRCDEDELYSLADPPTVQTICGCYRCGPWPITDPFAGSLADVPPASPTTTSTSSSARSDPAPAPATSLDALFSKTTLTPHQIATLIAGVLLLDDAKHYGLIDSGPVIDRPRCDAILLRLAARGIRPDPDEAAAKALELMAELGAIRG